MITAHSGLATEKLKIVDVVFTFNNSDLIGKLLRRGKVLKYGTNTEELSKIDSEIKTFISDNFE